MTDRLRKTDIILIRHGESANNVTYATVREMFGDSLSPERYEEELEKLHNPDCGLSPKGLQQTEKLREYISSGGFRKAVSVPDEWKIFSSPMQRCLLTSQEISTAFGNKSVTVVPFLYESDGCYKAYPDNTSIGLPGMTKAEVEERFPTFTCEPGMENGWYTLSHKETRKEFNDRAQEVSDWLWQLHDQTESDRGFKTGMILSIHGNLIQSIITNLVKSSNMMLTHDNTGVAHVQLWSSDDNKIRFPAIVYTNRVDHLQNTPELVAGGAVVEDHWVQDYVA